MWAYVICPHHNTTYISDESLENVLKSIEKNYMLAIRWFENNYTKLNTDKCHLIVLGYSGISLKRTRYKTDTSIRRTVALGTDGS